MSDKLQKHKALIRSQKERPQFLADAINNNAFSLFSDDPEYVKATTAIFNLIEDFHHNLLMLQGEFCGVGATDTDARESIALYIAEDKLRLIRLSGKIEAGMPKSRRRKRPPT